MLTANVKQRRRVLSDPVVCRILVEAWRHAESAHGWLVGRYVVMPDHVHFFASPAREPAKALSGFMNYWKRSTAVRTRAQALPSFAWQPEFHDHLLRRSESYQQKWRYVRENPVRAGLVADASDWSFQGEVNVLAW